MEQVEPVSGLCSAPDRTTRTDAEEATLVKEASVRQLQEVIHALRRPRMVQLDGHGSGRATIKTGQRKLHVRHLRLRAVVRMLLCEYSVLLEHR